MKKTNTKIFAICLAATMVGTTTNFTTRTLAAETNNQQCKVFRIR